MMHALHTVVVLLALGAQDDVTPAALGADAALQAASPSSPADTVVDDDAAPAGDATPPAAGVTLPADDAPADVRPVVAFLGVASSEAERQVASRIDEDVRALLLADRELVFSPSSAPVLESACFDDGACRATQAALLEGSHVVAARVHAEPLSTDGAAAPSSGVSKLRLGLVLFERESGRVESELTFVEADEAALLARLPAAYASLFSAIRAPAVAVATPEPVVEETPPASMGPEEEKATETPAGPRRLESAPAAIASVTSEKQSLDEGLSLGTWIYMGAFVVGGAALVLSGAAFDVISPTSTNGALDPLDAVGPGLVVTGGLVAVIGVVTALVFEPFAGSRDAEEN